MTKKLYSLASILLTSLITLLGFCSCKTKKQVIIEPPKPYQMNRADSINAGLIPPPEQKVKPADPIKVVYGPPPARKVQEEK